MKSIKKTWLPAGGKDQVIAEIEKFHGNLSVVAKSFQISRNTIAKYVANHADVTGKEPVLLK